MTTREKAHELLDRLSEPDLEAEYERLRAKVEGESHEELEELNKFSANSSRGVLRRMAEEEEKAGMSWEEFRPR